MSQDSAGSGLTNISYSVNGKHAGFSFKEPGGIDATINNTINLPNFNNSEGFIIKQDLAARITTISKIQKLKPAKIITEKLK